MNWLPSTVVFALTIYASQCTPLPPAIYNASFSSLSLYSYFDTVSYTDATDQLVTFLSANRFALVNQFVCESYDPVHFAAWSRKVNDATGAQVHVLFDNAVWNASTTCTKECVNADSVPTGWCCGGIDAKLQWAQEVLNNNGAIDGVNFDIEHLKSAQATILYQTVRQMHNDIQLPSRLGASFDVTERGLFNSLLASRTLDDVYVENYFNDPATINEGIVSTLQNAHSVNVPPSSLRFVLETECCNNPCEYSDCTKCPTTHPNMPLPDRNTKSFCPSVPAGGYNHLLSAISSASAAIQGTGLQSLMAAQGGQGLFEYQTLYQLVTGKLPAGGRRLCAAPGPTPPPSPPPPSPVPKGMQVTVVNQAGIVVTIRMVSSVEGKYTLLGLAPGSANCVLEPGERCVVAANFQAVAGTASGDKFDTWWGDGWKTAITTLTVSKSAHKGYLEYTTST